MGPVTAWNDKRTNEQQKGGLQWGVVYHNQRTNFKSCQQMKYLESLTTWRFWTQHLWFQQKKGERLQFSVTLDGTPRHPPRVPAPANFVAVFARNDQFRSIQKPTSSVNIKNKMKPTNPNADTYVEKQRLNTYLSQFPANPFVEHPDLTHWGDTLVGHPCLTLLRYALVRHSCMTLWFDTLAGHSCLTLF